MEYSYSSLLVVDDAESVENSGGKHFQKSIASNFTPKASRRKERLARQMGDRTCGNNMPQIRIVLARGEQKADSRGAVQNCSLHRSTAVFWQHRRFDVYLILRLILSQGSRSPLTTLGGFPTISSLSGFVKGLCDDHFAIGFLLSSTKHL